jgi:hypothetical protein
MGKDFAVEVVTDLSVRSEIWHDAQIGERLPLAS